MSAPFHRIRFGYPCQNETIPATTNRGIKLASIGDCERIQNKIQANLDDLESMLHWNVQNNIELFRIGQHLIPFASHPDFPYAWTTHHTGSITQIGKLAQENGLRLSMHPGQFINPGSPNDEVVERSLAELAYSATVLDLLQAKDGVIVLHLGGAYGDKPSAMRRFIEVMRNKPQINRYLALEVDERVWTADEVTQVASELGVGAIIDNLHHRLNPGGLTLIEAIKLARPTWKNRPKLHLSSQDPSKKPGAHHATILPEDWEELLQALHGEEADIMVEAKGKEKAVIPLQRALH